MRPLAATLLAELAHCAVDLKTDDFVKNRKSDEARKKFATLYESEYSELIPTYDYLLELAALNDDDEENPQNSSFYFDGLPTGRKLGDIKVDIGEPPFPTVPPAKWEWRDKEHFSLSAPFVHDGQELIHVKKGLAIQLAEHEIFRKILEQFVIGHLQGTQANKEFTFPNMKLCQAALLQQTVRMFWPGRTHMVFADPRGKKSGEKPKFHTLRLEIAGEYLNDMATAELGDSQDEDVEKEPKVWAELLKDQFERLRTRSYMDFAIGIGFGEPWYKNTFQGGKIKIFEDFPKAWTRPTKKRTTQPPPPQPEDDDDDDDENNDAPPQPPAPPPPSPPPKPPVARGRGGPGTKRKR
jgi:hypothetical protein